jgi:IS5 family transposase
LKLGHRMDRYWLRGALGGALHSISCAAGYNLRWLLRAVARSGMGASYDASGRVWTASMSASMRNRV